MSLTSTRNIRPEHQTENAQAEQATIGYGLHPFADKTITDEFYEEPFKLNAAQYNVYAAEWTASAVHFYINQVKVKTIAQAPHYPMQWMLNIYDLADPAEQAGPMEFWVDYVAGYAPAM